MTRRAPRVAMFAIAAACVVLAASGCSDRNKPAATNTASAPEPAPAPPPPGRVAWVTDEASAFTRARAEGKGVMIELTASWCAPCLELELVLDHPSVRPAVTERFVPLRFDVTEDSDADREVQARYGAETLPALLFLDAEGKVLAHVKDLVGEDDLLAIVVAAGKAR